MVLATASPAISDNDIHENQEGGISFWGSASPTISGNNVHENQVDDPSDDDLTF